MLHNTAFRKITTLLIFSFLTVTLLFGTQSVRNTNVKPENIAFAQGVQGEMIAPAAPRMAQVDVTPVPTEKKLYLPSIPRNYPWNNPFGVELDVRFGNNEVIQSYIKSLQVKWVRLNNRINWRELQSVEGGPIAWENLAMVDAELRFLKENGMTPIMIVDDYPLWATVGARSDGVPTSCGRITADKLPAFAAFMEQVVQRYSTPEFNLHYWEMGNEPDVDPRDVPPGYPIGCWGNVKDLQYYGGWQYGEMLKVVSPSIRRADPAAVIMIGGLLLARPNTTEISQGKPENFFNGILAAGAAPYFDIVAYHWYPSYYNIRTDYDNASGWVWDAMGGGVAGKALFLRNVMKQYGVNKPLFLNETALVCPNDWNVLAWCVTPDQQFNEAQAQYLVRSFVRGMGANVMGFNWYTLEGPGWRSSGLLDSNYAQKPGYQSYQHLINQLMFSDYSGPVILGEGLEAYTFKKGDQLVQVVWAKGDTTINVVVSQEKFIASSNLYGSPITPSVSGSNAVIPVGFSPVYIIRKP